MVIKDLFAKIGIDFDEKEVQTFEQSIISSFNNIQRSIQEVSDRQTIWGRILEGIKGLTALTLGIHIARLTILNKKFVFFFASILKLRATYQFILPLIRKTIFALNKVEILGVKLGNVFLRFALTLVDLKRALFGVIAAFISLKILGAVKNMIFGTAQVVSNLQDIDNRLIALANSPQLKTLVMRFRAISETSKGWFSELDFKKAATRFLELGGKASLFNRIIEGAAKKAIVTRQSLTAVIESIMRAMQFGDLSALFRARLMPRSEALAMIE